jgi:hypothetical protein
MDTTSRGASMIGVGNYHNVITAWNFLMRGMRDAREIQVDLVFRALLNLRWAKVGCVP